MITPKQITITGTVYDCPKYYISRTTKAKASVKPPSGHIFITKEGWAKPTSFRFPTNIFNVSGTPEHPVLTSKN